MHGILIFCFLEHRPPRVSKIWEERTSTKASANIVDAKLQFVLKEDNACGWGYCVSGWGHNEADAETETETETETAMI